MTPERGLLADYSVIRGIVTAAYAETVRLQSADGRHHGLEVGKIAQTLPRGSDLSIVSMRDSERAVFIVDHSTGRRHPIANWHGSSGSGIFKPYGVGWSLAWFAFLLVPFLGQFLAVASGIGSFATVIAFAGIKGQPPIAIVRVFVALVVYGIGSIILLSGWLGNQRDTVVIGWVVVAVGAVALSFWARAPAANFVRTLDRFVDEIAGGRA